MKVGKAQEILMKNTEIVAGKIINEISAELEKTDVQGINFAQTQFQTREKYRKFRKGMFNPYKSTDIPDKKYKKFSRKSSEDIYSYQCFYKGLDLTTGHFQLRSRLVAQSNHDLIFLRSESIGILSTEKNCLEVVAYNDMECPTYLSSYQDFICICTSEGKGSIYNRRAHKYIFYDYLTQNSENDIMNQASLINVDSDNHLYLLTACNDCTITLREIDSISKSI